MHESFYIAIIRVGHAGLCIAIIIGMPAYYNGYIEASLSAYYRGYI
jgi:hypothetical protein